MTPRILDIQTAVCTYFGIPLIDMRSERRARHISHPRQLAMYLARQLTPSSYPMIGREFGGKDHSTVIHALNQVARRLAHDSNTIAAKRWCMSEIESRIDERACASQTYWGA